MGKIKTFNDLFVQELKDLYSAENQLIKALPKMAKGATSPALKKAFEKHFTQTQGHVKRLEKISSEMGVPFKGHKCKAMEGLIEEGAELLNADIEPNVLDAALIGAAQRVEHYEMAGYGVAKAFATLLDLNKIADLLDKTLQEEGDTDKSLTELAMNEINIEALQEA